jgi:amino acid adenylation domain-containing protein
MSLLHALRKASLERPGDAAFLFLANGEDEAEVWSFGELDRRARAIGALLQPLGPASRVLLLFPPGLDFLSSFLGCLYAGCVAVPAYPPQSNRGLPRLHQIVQDAQPGAILTSSAFRHRLPSATLDLPALGAIPCWSVDEIDPALATDWQEPDLATEDLALLQYTSGSTSLPKGVKVSHGNLLHNEEMVRQAFIQSPASVVVSWLPPYHDMGLIGGLLQPLYVGARCVLMSPMAFLQKPLRWLRAVSRYRGTTSGGPNFAYDLCVRRIGEAERADLDLSSWTLAFNGAEPVRAETLERFATAFSPCGFRKTSFYACYGLAEATLFVAGGTAGSLPREMAVDAAELARNQVVELPPGHPGARLLVGCGHSWNGQRIAVIDPESGLECPPSRVGEICVEGQSVSCGYWSLSAPTELQAGTAASPADGPRGLRTGDLGFLSGGELFITGRLKDLIIVRGRNHYPQDLELTAERSHPALRPGGGAAFSIEVEGDERVVLACEVGRHAPGAPGEIADAVRRAVAEEHELQVHEVVLLRMGTLPKTSSGKVQRHACRTGYLAGTLDVIERVATVPPDPSVAVGSGRPLDQRALLVLDPDERLSALVTFLRREAARVTRVPVSQIDSTHPLIRHGLDSLAAVELQQKLEEGLGVLLPLGVLLNGASLEELAESLLSRMAEETAASAAGGWSAASEHALSDGQRALWYLHRLAPESAAYNIAGAARVRGELRAAALSRTLTAVVARHPALRTTFHAGDPEPWQRIDERPRIDFSTADASAWSPSALQERVDAEAWRSFDLSAGPLVRCAVFSLSSTEHVLVLAVHHVVADLWSMAVLVREMGRLYGEETGGPAASLEPLATRFADTARRQREQVDGPEGERSWAYWKTQLGGFLPPLELPRDRPRPLLQTYSGAVERLQLGAGLTGRIGALARSAGATLYTVLLAAFQALLYHYTGQEDLLVGSPTAGRSTGDQARRVGYFVNPVVLRTQVVGELPFAALLERVRRTALAAFEHQGFPFLRLAERLQPQRDPSRSPLFQALFTLQRAPGAEEQALAAFALGVPGAHLALGDLDLESMPLTERSSQLDISLAMADLAGGLAAALRYNTDLFDAVTMRRMLGHFLTLLGGAVEEPGRRTGDLPLLSAEEERQLSTSTAQPCPVPSPLHTLFEEQARRRGEAIAVLCGEESLSYGELNARANRLGRHLRALGVGPEILVGIYLQRSLDLVVAILGVLKAGGAYVPLEPANPRERLEHQLADSGTRVVVTRGELAGSLFAPDLLWVCLDHDAAALGACPPLDLPGGAGIENLAYVIYTSGSTGGPKGVGVPHENVVRLFSSVESFGFDETDVWTLFHSYAFDFSVWELWGALLHGGCLVVVPYLVSRSPGAFYELLATRRVTVLSQTPSAFRQLVRYDEGAGSRGSLALRWVIFGGEALEPASLRPWLARHGDETPRLINMYGITETTVHVTWRRVVERDILAEEGSEIGEPLRDLDLYLLSRDGRLVPWGVHGELQVAGAGLARGYLGRPELTAERFVPDPFDPRGGARLYRSGDMARRRPDSGLEYLGRIDQQVKIRGFRIELGEIESALTRHPAVREAAVVARRDGAGETHLFAYVACRGEPPSAGELRDFLSAALPEHMLPSAFVALESLPLTANGKVDRRALPAPEQGILNTGTEHVPPRTALERQLAEIWRQLLGAERIGRDDDFFTLGGHSLLATRLLSRVRDELGVEVPLAALFESRALGELAKCIEELGPRAEMPPVERFSRAGGVPLSFAQERLWFLDRLAPGSPAYNMPATIRLDGDVDVVALARSLTEVVRRHEALRTTLRSGPEGPRQHVSPPSPLALPLVDLAGLPPVGRRAELGRLAAEEARLPFDLARGPLIRITLCRMASREQILLANLHHAVADGWSVDVLIREVTTLLAAFSRGLPSPLPELSWQYADFTLWQRQRLAGAALDEPLAWWREQLRGAPAELSLPFDLPPDPLPDASGRRHALVLPPGLGRALHRLGNRSGCTLFMTLLAGFQALLYRWAGEEDVIVGTPVANRDRRELEDLIGLFVNTLVLRTNLAGRPSSLELLERVRQMALGVYAHQELPFERLVEALRPERTPGHSPFFQVMFSLRRAVEVGRVSGGLSLLPVEIDTGIARWALALELAEEEVSLAGWLQFQSGRFHAVTIIRLGEQLGHLLEGMVAQPTLPVTELSVLGAAERQQLLVEWNATPGERGEGRSVPELFADQADATPEAVALEFDSFSLTYRELSARADQLAVHLVHLGVGPEVRVALFLERSPEMVVGLLGVLRAGGAYVPLDPSHPRERLGYLLADSGAAVVVTHQAIAFRLPPHGAQITFLNLDAPVGEREAREHAAALRRAPAREDAAYLIYTSGTTGRPKAVLVEHGNLAHTLAASREVFGWAPRDRMPALAPFAFDIFLFELLNPLLVGGSCRLFSHQPALDLRAVAAALPGLTRLHAVPVVMRELIREVRATGLAPERLGSVRTLFVGGDAVPPDLLAEMRETFPAAEIHILYGPTEGTIICCHHAVPRESRVQGYLLGRPLPRVSLRLLDLGGQPAPLGVAGELWLGGPGVARGYLGREELTAERFVGIDGSRFYRTGDRARWRPDGVLEFLGRLDQQVKVRGIRVEPGEVESALFEHPGVREAVVIARADAAGERRLVAYVVPSAPAPTDRELLSFLRGRLPEALVPAAVLILEALPLTPHGKVDRRALPAPEPRAPERGTIYVAPRTPTEEILAGIWRTLLAVERVGVEDDFFALGGHSLLAIRLISRVRDALGLELPLAASFEARTLGAMAQRIDTAAPQAPEPPLGRFPRGEGEPLSHAQERLWFLDQLEPGSPSYNLPAIVRLPVEIDLAVFERSLTEVVRRHESLRTTFRGGAGGPLQHIAPPSPVPLPIVDLAALPPERRHGEAGRLSVAEARRPFDLAAGPLLRTLLLRSGPGEQVLVANLHHIVADAGSVEVLGKELAVLYPALRLGAPSPLPELPVQYADFAQWQRLRLSGAALDELLSWWSEQLNGAPPELSLPFEAPLGEAPGFHGGMHGFDLPPVLVGELRRLGDRQGCTLFMVLLAAFQALLHRWSGEEDIVVGSPVANRNRRELEDLIGFFVNTLVLRTSLGGRPRGADLLERVRRTALGAYSHQELPFERLVEELRPERSLGRDPFFQVMFSLLREPDLHPHGDLPLRPLGIEIGISRWVLDLELAEREGGLAGRLRFQTGRFHAATVCRMAGHFCRLLEGMAAEPERPVAELPMLSAAEQAQVMEEWGSGGAAPAEPLVHEAIEAWAARFPAAPAVLSAAAASGNAAGPALRYGELERQANRLAHHLLALGIGPESPVGILLDRSPDAIVGLLAILKSGGVCLPLVPDHPSDRLARLLADAGAGMLLTQSHLLARLGSAAAAVTGSRRVVDLTADAAEIARHPETRPVHRALPGHLAYIFYTSGSTGTPKGVAIEHRSLAAYLAGTGRQWGSGPGDRILQLASPGYDASLEEIFLALGRGAALVLRDEEMLASTERFFAAAGQCGITALSLPTAFWHQLVADLGASGAVLPPGLRLVSFGGEKALADRLAQWQRHGGAAVRMLNTYGPTEGTIVSTACEVTGQTPADVPIGRPLPGVGCRVLTPDFHLVPAGAEGELFLAGSGLARGYLGRPDWTAEKFIPDPWPTLAGERLYRTGDRVRFLPDGTLQFLGRVDHQVKIRGFRIELGEIEAVLAGHPALREIAVVAREVAPGELRLVLYAVPSEAGLPPSTSDLRGFLAAHLPDFMVPARFVFLDNMPLTPSGKLDRRRLPAPERLGGGESPAPSTLLEGQLGDIWRELLAVERVSREDDFFALGGHSLLAIRLISRVRAALGVELPLAALFESRTLGELAARIERAAPLAAAPPLVRRSPQEAEVPLSFSQERLWFLDQLDPGSSIYNMPALIRLEGELDAAAFARSLAEVAWRHEALRTRFRSGLAGPLQEVVPPAPATLPVVDLAGLPGVRSRTEADLLAREEAKRPFDLAAGPLFRAALLRLAPGEQLLAITLHHIVGDGWSVGVLIRELAALYPALRAGTGTTLPELPVQYGDYALWQRRSMGKEALAAGLSYWRERLKGLEPLELPVDRPRRLVQGSAGATETLRVPAAVAASLRELGRHRGETLFMTLLAAFQVLLWRHTGQRDLAVGSPVANRSVPELEELIGFFVNMLVLRGDLSGEPTVGELLGRVRRTALEAYAHQEVPFEKLVEALRPERSLSQQPLFQVALEVDEPWPSLELPGLALSPVVLDGLATQFDLILEVENGAEALAGHLRYRTELFDRTTVARLRRHFETLLAGLALAAMDLPVRELPWLSAAEHHQILVEWADTASDYGRERTIPDLFLGQAQRYPEAIAVTAGERSLSYGELLGQAARLSRRLSAWGVRRGDIVGLSLGRTPGMVIGMLGILEAGAAYLPLDVAYPRERLALLIRDAGVRLVLASPEHESAFAGLVGRIASLDGEEPEEPENGTGLPERPSALDLAYVMYTSGSSGAPKGVAVPHRAVVRLVRETTYARLDRDQVFLQLAPVAFDASTLEIWGPLLNGGRVVLYQGEPSSVAEIGRALLESGATSLFLTSGLFQAMVDGNPDGLAVLRQLMTGGDILSMPHVRRLRQKHPDLRLIHVYGPTENTTFSSFAPIGAVGERIVPIGRPIANTTMYVLSAELEPVPLGGAGELWVGGDGLARSYLGRPELTAEKLVPDPCSGEPGTRLYRTGDLARLLPDGEVDFLGRIDGQVKIRGFRIEPGEIETALRAHPAIREAVVVPWGEGAGDRRLVAYLVPAEPGVPTAGDFRRFLAERLPEHLIPSLYVALESLPLNANGKVDRRALPEPGHEALGLGEISGQPQTPTEEILAGIWSEVLGRGQVGIDESFFDLGGHSLLATQAVSRMSAAFGLEVPLQWIFETPTVVELARQIDESARRARGVARPPLAPAPRDVPLPLSFAQQRIWFLDRLDPGSSSYNVPLAVRFDGSLATELLARGLGEVARRHEALRTRFVLAGAEPVQVIDPPSPVALPRIDLRSLPTDARQAEGARLAEAEAQHPFDLQRGPVFRALLLRTGEDEHRLLLTFHHIVADGWSMGILVRELTELYEAGVLGRAPELPALPVQYADFAQWQRGWLQGDILDGQLAYWRAQLAGARAELPLPADRRRPERPTFRAERRPLTLEADLVASLGALARRERATLFMVLLTGFQTLLARCSGQTDVVVGTPIAGRGHEATEALIGFFANTLVLRADLAGNPSFREALARIRRVTLDAYAHQDLPFDKLVEILRPERRQGRNPLFAVLFALQNAPLAPLAFPGLRVAVEDLEAGAAKFDLVLSLAEAADRLQGGIEYDSELFEAATIDGLLRQYETLLRAVVQDPEARIAHIPLTVQSLAPRRRALPADLEKLLERI